MASVVDSPGDSAAIERAATDTAPDSEFFHETKVSTAEGLFLRAIAWGSAGAFFFGVPALVKPHWGAIVDFLGGPRNTVAGSIVAASAGTVIAANLAMLPVYYANHPFFERFRISNREWDFRSPDPKVRETFWAKLKRSIVQTISNNVLLAFPAGLEVWALREYVLPAGSFSTDVGNFPTVAKIFWQIYFCVFWEDFTFYWTHRTLHERAYWIHKRHHEWNQTITINSEHAHPIEFILGNQIPVLVGPILLSILGEKYPGAHIHTFTLVVWIIHRLIVSEDEHCGYTFPYSPVRAFLPWFVREEPAHDFHHSHNAGMYASQTGLWDWFFGTDKAFKAWLAKRGEKKGN